MALKGLFFLKKEPTLWFLRAILDCVLKSKSVLLPILLVSRTICYILKLEHIKEHRWEAGQFFLVVTAIAI